MVTTSEVRLGAAFPDSGSWAALDFFELLELPEFPEFLELFGALGSTAEAKCEGKCFLCSGCGRVGGPKCGERSFTL